MLESFDAIYPNLFRAFVPKRDVSGETLAAETHQTDPKQCGNDEKMFHLLPNVKDEPRRELARLVRQHEA